MGVSGSQGTVNVGIAVGVTPGGHEGVDVDVGSAVGVSVAGPVPVGEAEGVLVVVGEAVAVGGAQGSMEILKS